MARDFNQNRIANARLVNADIDKFGRTFAIQSPYNADGFSSVNVTVEQAPSDIKQYLEGDNSITVYPVPSNIDKLCYYALASFPSIEDLYLFKTSAIVVLEDDLSYLLDLNKIYVPTDLLSAYQSAYPTIASKFDIIVEDYTLTIPFVGETTLTSEYVDSVIAMLSNAEKNAITKVVIPTDFTQESANDIAWGYNFSDLANLNSIWYGATQYDFSIFTIQDTTQDHILTASVVETELGKISSDKLTLVEKIVVPIDFTSYASGSITELQAFMNTNSIDKLVTTYSGGAMELDLQGDIVAKITSINKTLDQALVTARTLTTSTPNDNIIIVPPMSLDKSFKNCSNLVYVCGLSRTTTYVAEMFRGCGNLLKIEGTTLINVNNFGSDNFTLYANAIKVMDITFINSSESASGKIISSIGAAYGPSGLTRVILNNANFNITTLQYNTGLDRQALVDLINSLGTPSTQKTLTIGATNLAKLTAEDVAIATAKNWVLQ